MKNNQQKEQILKLTKEKEKLEKDLKKEKENRKIIENKYNKLKDNQDQLIMLLKLVEKEGVNLENIITKWNSQMDEEDGNEKNENSNNSKEEDNNEQDFHSDEELDKDGEFLPLTLEDNNIINNTVKIQKANVPKLDFAGIKLFDDKKQINEKGKVKKGLNNYEKIIKKK